MVEDDNYLDYRCIILWDALNNVPVWESYKSTHHLMKRETSGESYIKYEHIYMELKNQKKRDLHFDTSEWKPTATIKDLPLEMLEQVVKKLNYESRMAVRKVNKCLQDLVDNAAITVDSVHFFSNSRRPANSVLLEIYEPQHLPDTTVSLEYGNNFELACSDMMILLRSKTQVTNLVLDYSFVDAEFERLVERFEAVSVELAGNGWDGFPVQKLWVKTNNCRVLARLLSYLSRRTLSELSIYTGDLLLTDSNLLFGSAQWRTLQTVQITGRERIQPDLLHHFGHLKEFYIHISERLTNDNLLLARFLMALHQSPVFEKGSIKIGDENLGHFEEDLWGLVIFTAGNIAHIQKAWGRRVDGLRGMQH